MSAASEPSSFLPQAGLPLAGLRIIAVEQYGAGPFGTQHLADLGAEVIKIENPRDGGDVGRSVGPYYFGPGDSHFYQSFNRNKKSITLDLKLPEGKKVLRELAAGADVVFNNLRGDLPGKLGLTYEQLKDVNPQLVCGHLSAYGRSGSRAAWPSYDYLMQAEAGYLSLTGEPDGPPARMGLSIIDLMTGTTAAMGLLAGVLGARASGQGRDIDVSLFDVALHNLAYVATWYLNAGKAIGREPRSGHPSLTPSQLYKTRDGWIFLMCNKEKFFGVLAECIGKPEWISAPHYKTFKDRLANRERLTEELDAVLQQEDTAEWMRRFAGKVPAAPVYDVQQALDSDFVREQERVLDFAHPEGDVRMVASPVRAGPHPVNPAPSMGAHTDELLRELGYDAENIDQLRQRSVI
ncbi:CaiB/BaiF CoA transferase family protein [Bordetella holmesii]|uniref:CoA-transferase family III protein n=2 Tax=Bordetella holmesii TaxID=35814 RepID=A0A158M558_9BORD|nr:CoA transferase [Bordetella holmesii]AIT24825.1 coA-transferase III family protein [Bordetella holmesii 44057]EWM45396.1 coA-transferase III family protein [Bordetella holmesii 70147]EWM48200.1 coA-transferase III family protein [Bordetella holmesii 41130]EWM49511.1 coA-transferase III family protein [Bordetella holmesii 35009]AMD44114.1 CoA-transferase [Bordetella holmesii H558]